MLDLCVPYLTLQTPMSAAWNGSYIYLVSGGGLSGNRLARYLADGTLDLVVAPGVDFRSVTTSNVGTMYAKDVSSQIFVIAADGTATVQYSLPGEPNGQSSASLNASETELYTMSNGTVRRYNLADGVFIASFGLSGWGAVGTETSYPDNVQLETSRTGRLFTYTAGIVSEWNTGGTRLAMTNVPIDTGGSQTTFSFGVADDDRVYLLNETTQEWERYDIGL